MRRTKIVATLGPASDPPSVLRRMLAAGVDVARLNYSHDTRERHAERAALVRSLAARLGRDVAIMADLSGPKIRIGGFREGPIELAPGDRLVIDTALPLDAGDAHQVGVTYKALPRDVHRGDRLVVDDGRILLEVTSVRGTRVTTRVRVGGVLAGNKGLNLAGGGLSAPALTRKDHVDLRHAAALDVDYLAVSFVRHADDVRKARRLLRRAGCRAAVIAKIERAEALAHVEEIMAAADGIMVARGDLGVEIGDARLVPVQKRLLVTAREMNRVTITATQMMQSMVHEETPTRAEVFDVANAVLDGTDAVMLSAETTIGRFPVKTVETMARICEGTEQEWAGRLPDYRIDEHFERIDQAIAVSAVYAANRLGARAILALTETGATCLWMSRMSTAIPIFAFTPNDDTRRRVALYRGVYPMGFRRGEFPPTATVAAGIDRLLARRAVRRGDTVVVTKGAIYGQPGRTNTMLIVRVGEPLDART